MNILVKRLVISTALVSVSFLAGTIFGFINGFTASALVESTPKGLLAVTHLKSINAGKPEKIKLFLESDVDQALALYPTLKKSWWYPAFQSGIPLIDLDNYDEYIRKVANYRKTHPSLVREDAFDTVPADKMQYQADYKELAADLREYKRNVRATVEFYADR